MPTTETNLFMLTGMIDLKNKINAVAAKVLPLGTMNHEKFASFKNTSVQGGGAKDLDELYEQAERVLPNFQKFMKEIVEGLGKDPDAVPKVEGEPVVDEWLTFKVLTTAPLKGRVRTEEKVSGWSGRERESGGEEVSC